MDRGFNERDQAAYATVATRCNQQEWKDLDQEVAINMTTWMNIGNLMTNNHVSIKGISNGRVVASILRDKHSLKKNSETRAHQQLKLENQNCFWSVETNV